MSSLFYFQHFCAFFFFFHFSFSLLSVMEATWNRYRLLQNQLWFFSHFFELEFVKCASLLSLTWIIMHIWKVFYLNPKLQVLKVLINLTFTDWQLGMFQSLHIQILWLQKCANMNWSLWKQTHATCKIGLIDGLGL